MFDRDNVQLDSALETPKRVSRLRLNRETVKALTPAQMLNIEGGDNPMLPADGGDCSCCCCTSCPCCQCC